MNYGLFRLRGYGKLNRGYFPKCNFAGLLACEGFATSGTSGFLKEDLYQKNGQE